MGLCVRDHFIDAIGEDVTLRKVTVPVFNDYDELESFTPVDTTIKVLMSSGTAQVYPREMEGRDNRSDPMDITFKSDCTVVIGDFIVIGSVVWLVDELNKRTYRGMSPFKGRIIPTPT